MIDRLSQTARPHPQQLAAITTFAMALAVYLMTLAPTLTQAHFGGDGGELITASVTLGVPHPQGYPTYTLLGKLFSALPLGPIAYRFNLFSAVAIAGAAAVMTATLMTAKSALRHAPFAAMAASLTFAFSPLVWSQAIITEVYGLNLLTLAVLLWACARGVKQFWLGLLWGLSLTTHLTSLLMLPLVLWHSGGQKRPHFVAGVLLGLLPFAALPLLARGNSVVVWSDPTTFDGWWWLVSGRIYRPNVFSHSIVSRLGADWLQISQQFAFAGWFAIVLGVRRHGGGQTLVYLATALLYGVYALAYDTPDYAVFMLPALLLLTPLLANGFLQLPQRQFAQWGILLLPIVAIALNFNTLNLRHDRTTETQSLALLDALPPAAIALTPGDTSIFALWYYQQVEVVRSDVILVDENLFAFDWYRARLARLYPALIALGADDLPAFRQTNAQFRPICTVSLHTNAVANCFGNSE